MSADIWKFSSDKLKYDSSLMFNFKHLNYMKYDNRLLTNFLDECNIKYEVDDNFMVSFEYDGRYLFGNVYNPEEEGEDEDGFVSGLTLFLPGIREVAPFDVKKYLKLINQLNNDVPLAKFVLDEETNIIHINVAVPLDSSPEMDDLVPGLVRTLVKAHNVFLEAEQK